MAPRLNHTIVYVRDKHASATFFAEVLGLASPKAFYSFVVVEDGNGTGFDFLDTADAIQPQHYAFLVSESEFDAIFARLQSRNVPYWADPHRQSEGRINQNDGGRGVYFEEPSGHWLEIITRPYAR